MDKENNVSRIFSDSITDNSLADDLIQICIQKQIQWFFHWFSRSFNRTIWIHFENQKSLRFKA